MAKYKSEGEQEISRFIKILIGVLIFVLGVYFFTNNFVTSEYDIKKNGEKGAIDSSVIMVGSILNRASSEYYVMAFKSEDNDAVIFNTYLSLYKQKENALNIYTVDLDNKLNKEYYAEERKTDVKDIKDIKLSSPTLLKVKDGKIVKSVSSIGDIKKELGL